MTPIKDAAGVAAQIPNDPGAEGAPHINTELVSKIKEKHDVMQVMTLHKSRTQQKPDKAQNESPQGGRNEGASIAAAHGLFQLLLRISGHRFKMPGQMSATRHVVIKGRKKDAHHLQQQQQPHNMVKPEKTEIQKKKVPQPLGLKKSQPKSDEHQHTAKNQLFSVTMQHTGSPVSA